MHVANRGLITVSIMLATIMQSLDTTIANVALPDMQGSFSTSQDQIAWVLTSYIVSAAIATPLCGWLATYYGRKRLFLISVAGFTIASVMCGFAGSLAQMVIYRLLQGVFGAALVPLSQAVLLDINPPEKHGSAMGIWGAGVTLGPILGPTLGGYLTDVYNWRWVFYINLPIGILCFFGIWLFMTETKINRNRPFDFFGFAMLSIAVSAAQLLLDRGQLLDWLYATEIKVYFAVMLAAFWVFGVWTWIADHPFVDRALLKDRNFVCGCVFISAVGVVLYGTLALMPPFLHDLMGYPVMSSGFLMAPRGAATMVGMLIVGRLSGRIDDRLLMVFGFSLTAWSLWAMGGFNLQMNWWPIVWTGVVQGVGLAFLFIPMSTIAFATLDPKLRTDGTSIFSLVRNVGAAVGISFVEAQLARDVQVNHESYAAVMTPFNQALMNPSVQAWWNIHTTAGLAALNGEVNRQATMQAYVNNYLLILVIAVASMPLLLILKRARRRTAGEPAPVID